jgi:hypothetical protein
MKPITRFVKSAWSWFAFLIIPLGLFAAAKLFSLPFMGDWLKNSPKQTQMLVGLGFVGAFMINQVVSVYMPHRKLQGAVPEVLRTMGELVQDVYRQESIDIRINVLVADWVLWAKKEPRNIAPEKLAKMKTEHAALTGHSFAIGKGDKKVTLFTHQFDTYWIQRNRHARGDECLDLLVNQGACGLAFRSRKTVAADLVGEDAEIYNLCAEQIAVTRDLKFVLSQPIFKLKRNAVISKRVIGVVNFDSRTEGSERLIRDDKAREIMVRRAEAFSDLCSRLF